MGDKVCWSNGFHSLGRNPKLTKPSQVRWKLDMTRSYNIKRGMGKVTRNEDALSHGNINQNDHSMDSKTNEWGHVFAVKLLNSLPKEVLGAKSLKRKAPKPINGIKIHPRPINAKTLSLSWEVSELQVSGKWNKTWNFHCLLCPYGLQPLPVTRCWDKLGFF